jgi:rhamnogalacturonyl hydrolase YesR
MQTNLPSHAWSESGTPQWAAEESKEAFRWVFFIGHGQQQVS